MEAHRYNTRIEWINERIGNMTSPELSDAFSVATPPPFKNGVANVWSPEHLFTAAINSCFMTTFLAIAENSNFKFESFSCEASGKLEQVEGKYLMTEVELQAHLVIEDESGREKAERLLQKSEQACLISNSVKSRVTMKTDIQANAERPEIILA